MAARDIIQAAAGAAGATEANYIEDCFSCHLYTGTGASQTITNGIDLATKGGLVWLKDRSQDNRNSLFDTNRGTTAKLTTDSTYASPDFGTITDQITSFNTSGFTLGVDTNLVVNYPSNKYASWTFAKQPKFFDIVTYTGTGSNRTIAHNLGSTPGMIIVKRTDTTGNWQVYHRSLTSAANSIQLNLTAAQASAATVWNSTAPTSSVFSVGTDATVNASGGTYVAYLFAHDAGGFGAAGTDSVVSCGSFTTDGSGNATVNLGWEPQFVMIKTTSSAEDWWVVDNMRGMPVTGTQAGLRANLSNAENIYFGYVIPTATGFSVSRTASTTYIYLAIRRGPMKTPTDATKVFAPVAATSGTQTTGFPLDLMMAGRRAAGSGFIAVSDRLRGYPKDNATLGTNIYTSSTAAEDSTNWYSPSNWTNTTFDMGGSFGGVSSIFYTFRRAPGFFDVVCYTGVGGQYPPVNHNLGVTPELMIVKLRSIYGGNWAVYHKDLGATYHLFLNTTNAKATGGSWWASTAPTSTGFTVNYDTDVNVTNYTYVAYLFASCPGVSKVFSFTGNGSSQTIDCGFAAGARFVLIKRTDSTGDWWIYDSARGIVSANDPALALNSTAAEVTSADAVDPASSGFIVNQESTCNINVNSATYIGLAIA